jgi:GntR family transcriptional regulator
MVDPQSPRPTYQQLAEVLRRRVVARDYLPGAKLPSESEMTDEYGVSRDVVRRTLAVLRAEGLVTSVQGRGSYVRAHRVVRRRAADHYQRELDQLARPESERDDEPFTADHRDFTRFDLGRTLTVVAADDDEAETFGVEPGTRLLRRRFVFAFDGEPHRISYSDLPLDLVDGTPITDPTREPWPGGTMAQLASVGVQVTDVEEVVSARMPTSEEREELHIDEGVPVVCICRRMLAGGRVVEVCDIVIPADRVDLQYRMPLRRPEER